MQRPTPRIEVVKREEKEPTLVRFLRDCAVPSSQSALTVVARTAQSPVLTALGKVLAESNGSAMTLRVIVAQTDGADALDTTFSGHDVTVRWARHPRLAEAHEQLVLAGASWIGDCMRRDPVKRDAYECFAADCSQSARWASMAFERLWTLSEPMTAPKVNVVAAAPTTDAEIAVGLPSTDNSEPAPLASTRH